MVHARDRPALADCRMANRRSVRAIIFLRTRIG